MRWFVRRVGRSDSWQRTHGDKLFEWCVASHTPKGVWLTLYGGRRFVLLGATKRFACPTLDEAAESFWLVRTSRHPYTGNRMAEAERTIATFKTLEAKRKGTYRNRCSDEGHRPASPASPARPRLRARRRREAGPHRAGATGPAGAARPDVVDPQARIVPSAFRGGPVHARRDAAAVRECGGPVGTFSWTNAGNAVLFTAECHGEVEETRMSFDAFPALIAAGVHGGEAFAAPKQIGDET